MTYEVRYNFTGMRSHYSSYYETREEALKKVEALKAQHNEFKEKAKTMTRSAYRYNRGYYELKEVSVIARETLVLYNPHPEGKIIDDCTRRALTKILDIPYNEVKSMMTREAKSMGLSYNTRAVLDELMRKLKFIYLRFPQPIDICEAIEIIPHNRVIIDQEYEAGSDGHWVAMVDKKLYDTGSQAYDIPVVGYYYREED